MSSSNVASPSANWPVTRDLKLAYIVSLIIALLMTVVSVAGLLFPSRIYPTDELLESFVANDVVNLLVGLPVLLGSMWFARRGKLIGLLFWPGALMVVLYTYLAYVFAMPPNWILLIYLTLVASSAYTLIGLVASIDGTTVQQHLAGTLSEKLSGGLLIGLGILILVRGVGVIANAAISQTEVPATELPVLIADFLTAPAWAIGGVLLWQRKALGYVSGVGLLFQGSMLFIGLLMFFLLQPWLADVSFPAADFVVVLVMGSVCFVPLGLFARGVAMKER
ncbi:MAG: hypothetical protein JXA89_11860 [Anaerolineae bacterium]|nr:hypothetical protein [Anaerolineae bacterium]